MGVDNAAAARRYMKEIWSKGNLDAVDELVDADVVVKDTMGTNIRGRDELKALMKRMQRSFSDNTFELEDVLVSGDRVVVLFTWRGTQRGDFFGIRGTGRALTNPGVDVLRFVDGRVIEDLGYMDSYAMFQQVGALPVREKLASLTLPPLETLAESRP